VQALHLGLEAFAGVAVEAVGDQQHDRTLAEHAARPDAVVEAVVDAGAAGPVLDQVADLVSARPIARAVAG
jgi:hypothetical protein